MKTKTIKVTIEITDEWNNTTEEVLEKACDCSDDVVTLIERVQDEMCLIVID